jgi:hypothetical protein
MAAYTTEQSRQLNYLASCPHHGSTTMKREDLQAVLLNTGGNMLACGSLYDIVGKDIGAGIYRVTLQPSEPRWY